MWGYPGYGDGVGWLGMGLMMFFGLLITIGVVMLIVWLIRGSGSAGRSTYSSGSMNACEIAAQRYAKGEISSEEYQEICRTIGR